MYRFTDYVDIASRSSARGRQTMLRWQKQVFVGYIGLHGCRALTWR